MLNMRQKLTHTILKKKYFIEVKKKTEWKISDNLEK